VSSFTLEPARFVPRYPLRAREAPVLFKDRAELTGDKSSGVC